MFPPFGSWWWYCRTTTVAMTDIPTMIIILAKYWPEYETVSYFIFKSFNSQCNVFLLMAAVTLHTQTNKGLLLLDRQRQTNSTWKPEVIMKTHFHCEHPNIYIWLYTKYIYSFSMHCKDSETSSFDYFTDIHWRSKLENNIQFLKYQGHCLVLFEVIITGIGI